MYSEDSYRSVERALKYESEVANPPALKPVPELMPRTANKAMSVGMLCGRHRQGWVGGIIPKTGERGARVQVPVQLVGRRR